MTRRRPQSWLISQHEDQSWSVWHGNRSVASDLGTVLAAEALVRKKRISGEKVYSAAADGYRTDRTTHFAADAVQQQRADSRARRDRPVPRTIQVARERTAASRAVRKRPVVRPHPVD